MDQRHLAPTDGHSRSITIDTLRGFALLGILVPNMIAFAMPSAATVDIAVAGDTAANKAAFAITQTVFLGKFMFIFAMLFGAGVLMYARKFDAPAENDAIQRSQRRRGAGLWYRRCAILLVFGLIHAYLFWFGDILTWYAAAGFGALWWVRRWSTRSLILGGVASYILGALLLNGFTLFGLYAVNEGFIEQTELMGSKPQSEIAAYLGTNSIGQDYGAFISAFIVRFPTTFFIHLLLLPMFLPALTGIMMLGMAIYRNGLLTGRLKTPHAITLGITLITIGGTITFALHTMLDASASFEGAFLWQSLAQPVGIPLAFGYIFLVVGLAQTSTLRNVLKPLACVGRMALTNYALHTLVCTTLFYGYGFGQFGSIEYPLLWGVIVGIWTLNLSLSPLWLKHFRFGPLEWIWRCATYGQLVPIRVKNASSAQNS